MTPIKVDPYEVVVEHTVSSGPPWWALVAAGLGWLLLSALVAVLTYRVTPKRKVERATVMQLPPARPLSTALRAHR